MKQVILYGLLTLVLTLGVSGWSEEAIQKQLKDQAFKKCVLENKGISYGRYAYLSPWSSTGNVIDDCKEKIEPRIYCTPTMIRIQSMPGYRCPPGWNPVCDGNTVHMNPDCAPCRHKRTGAYYTMGICY